MKRRSILSIPAMTVLGLALLPGSVVAQQETLKQQLVGAWTLVSYENTAPNGTKSQPLSANPKGILILEAGGRYAAVFGRPDRPKSATAQGGFAANFGTWSVSEADKTLARRFESALVPNNEGTEVKTSVSLVGDELKLTGATFGTGVSLDMVFRRAR